MFKAKQKAEETDVELGCDWASVVLKWTAEE